MNKNSPLRPHLYLCDRQFRTNRESDYKALKIFKQKLEVNCAFHSGQKITNFCKNQQCLLPLCPKCIKIHSEQHAQSGSFSTFQSIDECLEEAHQMYINLFSDVNRLQKVSYQLEQTYKAKKEKTMQDFNKAKKLAFDYISSIFCQYEEALKAQINQDERIFTEGLIKYHDYIGKIMEKCRVGTKKLQNKHLLMEGLINFYMDADLISEIRNCEQQLNAYSISKIQVYTSDYELQNMNSIIKSYLKFGNDDSKIQSLRLQASLYDKQSNLLTKETQRFNQKRRQNEVNIMQNSEKSYLQNMESPLDKYSIQRSRSIRMNIPDNIKFYN